MSDKPNTLQVVFEIFNVLFSIPAIRAGESNVEERLGALVEYLPQLEFEHVEQVESYLLIMSMAAHVDGQLQHLERALLERLRQQAVSAWEGESQRVGPLSVWSERARVALDQVVGGALEPALRLLTAGVGNPLLREGIFIHVLAVLLVSDVVPEEVQFSRDLAHAFGFDRRAKMELIARAESIAHQIANDHGD